MRRAADAVVIGGGIHGCSVAYHLAKSGLTNVVLLEKDYLAACGTGRSAAGFRHQFGTEVNVRLSAKSVRLLETLADELEYPHGIELLQKGYLMLAYSRPELELFTSNVQLQHRLHPDNQTVILTPAKIHELNPYLNLEGVLGGSFNPRDGHANPWHTTQAYADAARRLGAEINTFTEVTGIRLQHDRVIGVDTTRGEILTPVVVNCAGPFGHLIGAMVGLEIPLVPQRHQILVTEPVGEVVPMMVISYTHGTYFKQTPHGSILMGYGDPEHEVIGLEQDSSWQFLEEVARKITYHMPVLRDVRVVRQWAGLYDMTPDSQAILGAVPQVEGFYMDVGWSGHGFQLGPIVGQVLAEIILGETPAVNVDAMRYTRFAENDLCPEPACV
jgi:sarcosine oxidase, subunit beta